MQPVVHQRRQSPAATALRWLAAALALVLPAGWAAAQSPLHYSWPVGAMRVYELKRRIQPLSRATEARREYAQIRLRVLQERGDRVLVLIDQIDLRTDKTHYPRAVIGEIDALGRLQVPEPLHPDLELLTDALHVIPPLPRALDDPGDYVTDDDRRRAWRLGVEAPDPRMEDAVRCAVRPAPCCAALSDLTDSRPSGHVWFDPDAGCVKRVELRANDGRQESVTVVRLRLTDMLDARWCQARAEEVEDYLAAVRRERDWLDQCLRHPKRARRLLDRLTTHWEEFARDAPARDGSPFAAIGLGRKARLKVARERLLKQAELADGMVGRLAAGWSLHDLAGHAVRSEALRDRLVLECFWSAERVPADELMCLLAALREQMPVVDLRIAAINLDSEPAAARRAAPCASGITHVYAGPPVNAQPLSEQPVFRLVDADSRVLAVWFGLRRDLSDQVSQYANAAPAEAAEN